ncbi:MAG: UDP-N-acetylmuramoyl-L-alanyl-D-glutamate--2,6-diaminopimelate ligase [Firmicutes bacterium]|nr:UDP-N-acetylmuramoyl-L-alanyl-D-glutamate--2,6-diaminopimelate ligase [Bacillota bacterium]
MKLGELIAPLRWVDLIGSPETAVAQLETDSRKVTSGALFACVRGYRVDGHDFAEQARQQGAVALLAERDPGVELPVVLVPSVSQALPIVADRFYGHPSHHLRVIGVTGTNGKTTTTHMVQHILAANGRRTGLMGTLYERFESFEEPAPNTTPEPVTVQRTLARMYAAGATHVVMEVSSHALEEQRVAGVRFVGAGFTNLTEDHLDYHKTMEAYRAAKGKLFSRLGNSYGEQPEDVPYAVANIDDPSGSYMLNQTVGFRLTYGLDTAAAVSAEQLLLRSDGIDFRLHSPWGSTPVHLSLVGRFNVYNALCAAALALCEGLSPQEVGEALRTFTGVAGRMESIDSGQPFSVFVDYAHTPDGLLQVLRAAREMHPKHLTVVFGCGGDREREKRPKMGAIAAQWADRLYLTSDNPRTEDPQRILDEVEAGVRQQRPSMEQVWRIADRAEAIREAIQQAESGDIVLIAGKGHEDYQIIGTQKKHFDDRQEARRALEEAGYARHT